MESVKYIIYNESCLRRDHKVTKQSKIKTSNLPCHYSVLQPVSIKGSGSISKYWYSPKQKMVKWQKEISTREDRERILRD